jgi:hypothetical protein
LLDVTMPTGDLRVLGLHLHLRQISTGSLPTAAEDPARPHAGKAPGNQGRAAATNAPDNPIPGTLVGASRFRPLRLLCGTHEQSGAFSVPALRRRPLAPNASAAQPEGWLDVGSDDETGRRLASRAPHPSSLAGQTFRRQTPEVRAGCSNRACPDLCGGCSVTGIPTANPVLFSFSSPQSVRKQKNREEFRSAQPVAKIRRVFARPRLIADKA